MLGLWYALRHSLPTSTTMKINLQQSIETIQKPDRKHFFKAFEQARKPVVIQGILDDFQQGRNGRWTGSEIILPPGDSLYIPPGYWHLSLTSMGGWALLIAKSIKILWHFYGLCWQSYLTFHLTKGWMPVLEKHGIRSRIDWPSKGYTRPSGAINLNTLCKSALLLPDVHLPPFIPSDCV